MLPIAEEEAVSSDGLDRKTSTHDENLLPSAEETLSSDGSDGMTCYLLCSLPFYCMFILGHLSSRDRTAGGVQLINLRNSTSPHVLKLYMVVGRYIFRLNLDVCDTQE